MASPPMIILEDDHVLIEADPELSLMRLNWKGFCHGDQYRQVLEKALETINELRLKFWLNDARQMGPILFEDEQWTINEITPRYQQSGLKRIAIIPSRDFFNKMSVERMVEATAPRSPYQIAYFREVPDAEAWLFGREKAIA